MWQAAPTSITIDDESIHVWLIDCSLLQHQQDKLLTLLSDEEKRKSNQFYFAQDRTQYILNHGACRLILSHYLEMDPTEIVFTETANGKPIIGFPLKTHLHFNLTHSGMLGMVAVSHRMVGIDLEERDTQLDHDELVETFMSPEELSVYHTLSRKEKINAFYRCWTQKEAYVKAIGQGLSYPVRQITVSLTNPFLLNDATNPLAINKWEFHFLPCPHSYQGSLVYQKGPCSLTYFQFLPTEKS